MNEDAVRYGQTCGLCDGEIAENGRRGLMVHRDSGDADCAPTAIGTRWHRNIPYREVVEIRRIWRHSVDGWMVRAHPIKGGKPLVAQFDWFAARYTCPTAPPVPLGDLGVS